MARRYRYAFTRRREAGKGKLSIALAVVSLGLFLTGVVLAGVPDFGHDVLVGCMGLFAAMLAAYGFIMGLSSFSETDRKHRTSIVGSISCGILLVGWIGIYLMGLGA